MKLKLLFTLSVVMFLSLGCNKPIDQTSTTPLKSDSSTSQDSQQSSDDSQSTSTKELFVDAANKINLDYSNMSVQLKAPSSYIPAQNNFTNGKELVALYVNPAIYSGTNLESAWLELAMDLTQTKASCYVDSTKTPPGSYNKTRAVQGNTWYYELPNPHGDAAAGHSETVETYRLYKNNLCYEVDLGASSFSRQNLENPNSIKEYDSVKIFSILGAVFNKVEVK